MSTIPPVFRRNGKASFSFVPARCLAGDAPSGIRAVLAVAWIQRELARWGRGKKLNVFDFMRHDGARGHTAPPPIPAGGAGQELANYMRRLVLAEQNAEFCRFARECLGFTSLAAPIVVPVRVPSGTGGFGWLADVSGSRLKVSPNEYHRGAVWLLRSFFYVDAKSGRLKVRISYGYRHDDTPWAIGIDQRSGEKIENFEVRAWQWLSDLVQWRHRDGFYSGFLCSAEGMRKSELQSNARAEQQMRKLAGALRGVFANGVGAGGYWENKLAESCVEDTHEQYRTVRRPAMTAARLRTIRKWLGQDRRRDTLGLARGEVVKF